MKFFLLLLFMGFISAVCFAQIDTSGQWTWVMGDTIVGPYSVYGQRGIPAKKNTPGGRLASSSWIDKSGNCWLYGGRGVDDSLRPAILNDLWKYDPSTDQWTWVSGERNGNVKTVYGSKGIPDPKNNPGSRSGSLYWTDIAGNFWLYAGGTNSFGGGLNSSNDLWKYAPSDNLWTWINGDSSTVTAVYGSKGIAAASNRPGSRGSSSACWTDKNGNLWFFGGGYYLNDLWKYDPSSDRWTWMSGDSISNVSSVYGTKGISSINNKPGSRESSSSWTDSNGNLWLFGGYHDMGRRWPSGYFNDLWKYDISTNQWAWINGDSTIDLLDQFDPNGLPSNANKPGGKKMGLSWVDKFGNFWLNTSGSTDFWKYDPITNLWTWMQGGQARYGTVGIGDSKNIPGQRMEGNAWVDGSGNFFVFGGAISSYVQYDNSELLNDLWKYDQLTSQWIWLKGCNTEGSTFDFGAKGVAGVTVNPSYGSIGAPGAFKWTDQSNNLWLFNYYNDLWKYDPSINMWTWVRGEKTFKKSVFGTRGIPNDTNTPCGRAEGVSWKDKQGNFWLFGGLSYESFGYELNDLWKYNPISNQWTWVNGDTTIDASSVYGIMGKADPANKPGSRNESASWVDQSGNLWLMGGEHFKSGRLLNDLWKYDPVSNLWTWVSGDSTLDAKGIYGTKGVVSATNKPAARWRSMSWTDNEDNFWLFSGQQDTCGTLNDLWKFSPKSNQWTWMKGDSIRCTNGVDIPKNTIFGVKGVAASANTPAPEQESATWTDKGGNLWLYGGAYNTDFWKYDPSVNMWTWMQGDSSDFIAPRYGTIGVSASGNFPGDISSTTTSWTDIKGNFWLMTGRGSYTSLWTYSPKITTRVPGIGNGADTTVLTNSVKVSPNPVSNKVTVRYPNQNSLVTIRVFDMRGVLLNTQNTSASKIEIDMAAYGTGMYIIRVDDRQKKLIGKNVIVKLK